MPLWANVTVASPADEGDWTQLSHHGNLRHSQNAMKVPILLRKQNERLTLCSDHNPKGNVRHDVDPTTTL